MRAAVRRVGAFLWRGEAPYALALFVAIGAWGVTARRLWMEEAEIALREPGISGVKLLSLVHEPLRAGDGSLVRIGGLGTPHVLLYFTRISDCLDIAAEVDAVTKAFHGSGALAVVVVALGFRRNEIPQYGRLFEVAPVVVMPQGVQQIASLHLPRTPYRVLLDEVRERILREGMPGRTQEELVGFLAELRGDLRAEPVPAGLR